MIVMKSNIYLLKLRYEKHCLYTVLVAFLVSFFFMNIRRIGYLTGRQTSEFFVHTR